MATDQKPKVKKAYTKSVTSFEGFLHQLKTNHEPYQDVQCDGFAHFLKYDLGNLNKLARSSNQPNESSDESTKSHLVNRNGEAKALVNGEEVQVYAKKEGKPVKIYAQNGPDGVSYTTKPPGATDDDDDDVIEADEDSKEQFVEGSDEKLIPLAIPEYRPTREDYMKVINQVRLEVKKKIIYPISKASGYKWEYSKGHFKDEILLLEFYCFQDANKDMQPSKFTNRHLVEIYKLCDCSSSVNVFINIITRQIRITYRHKSHTKLIDIIYSLLSQIYNE